MSFGFITTTTDKLFAWARKSSLWPMNIGLACCGMELLATGASHYDLDRFGIMVRSSPRQSDALLISGTVTRKMVPLLKRLYDQIPEPKYVIAMGSCASGGSCFYYDNYMVVRRLDEIFPVDVYIPGCPPRPEALLYGLMQLQEKIASSSKEKKK